MNQQQLILTTEQLAHAFGASDKAIRQNFQRHKDNFIEGKHYFLLEGEKFKNFEQDSQSSPNIENLNLKSSKFENLNLKSSKFEPISEIGSNTENRGGARKRYLWTQAGAFVHARFLNTSLAWNAYEKLIEQAEKAQSGVSQEVYFQLQEKLNIAKTALTETLTVPAGQGIDYALFGEFDRLVRRGHQEMWQLRQATDDKEILKVLGRIELLLKRLETVSELLQEQHDIIDTRFIEQADTLGKLSLSLTVTTPLLASPKQS